MAKKKSDSGFSGIFSDLLGSLTDLGLNAIIGNLKDAAEGAVSNAQKKIEQTTIKVLKTITVFIIMILGFIMCIVGLGQWLSHAFSALAGGLGTVVVGAALLLLGLLIQFFKS